MTDLQEFLQAAAFAARKHRLQRRKDKEASSYINHLGKGQVAGGRGSRQAEGPGGRRQGQ